MSNISDLIAKYVESTKKHGNATLNGDFKLANNTYREIIDIVRLVYDLDPKCEQFLELLKHENESVKLWAATHALFINETKALEVLQEVASRENIFSFSASLVVDEWKRGEMESPFTK